MPHIDQPGRSTGEAFDANNVMSEDFHSVMTDEPCNIVKQIDEFRGATDNSSLEHFPNADSIISSDNNSSATDIEIAGDDVRVDTGDVNAQSGDVEVTTSDSQHNRNSSEADADARSDVDITTGDTVAENGDHTTSVNVEGATININIDLPDIDNSIDFDPRIDNGGDMQSHLYRRDRSNGRTSRQEDGGDQFSSNEGRDDTRYQIDPIEYENGEFITESDLDTVSSPGSNQGLTLNIINITPNQLPNLFSDSLRPGFNGDFSPVPHSCSSLLRNLQGIFRPTDARFAQPRIPSPTDFISNLSNVLNGGSSNSFGLPSPGDFLAGLQGSLVPPGMEQFLPTPPSPENFIRDLTSMVGYGGDNQSIFPRLPRPEQFLAGLGRSLGFDSAPFGNSQMFRTLDCNHAMNGVQDFIPNIGGSPFDSILNFNPGNLGSPLENITNMIRPPFDLPGPFAGNFDISMPPNGGFIPDIISDNGFFPTPFSGDFNIPNPFSGNDSISLPGLGDSFFPTPMSNGFDIASMLPSNGSIPSPFDALRNPIGLPGLSQSHFDLARQGAHLGLDLGTVPLDIAESGIDFHTDLAKAPLQFAENLVGSDSPAAIPLQVADKAVDLHEDIAKAPIKIAKKAKDFFKKLF